MGFSVFSHTHLQRFLVIFVPFFYFRSVTSSVGT